MALARIVMDDETKTALESSEVVPREIDIRGRKFTTERYVAAGFKGAVWRGLDEYGGPVALKFTVYDDYRERSYLEEAEWARKLTGRGPFADFIHAGIVSIPIPSGDRKFVCFVEEWIDGWTLSEYLEDQEISASFLPNYVRGVCQALSILSAERLRHDDLRQANVMICRPRPGDLPPELKVKVIDMGSLKSAAVATKKGKDDHRWFTEHVVDIRNTIRRRKGLALVERRFLEEVDQLLDRMIDEDRTVALSEPTST